MISGRREASGAIVLERGGEAVPPRLLELRRKIHDESYIDSAVLRIAQVISRRLVENPEELQFME